MPRPASDCSPATVSEPAEPSPVERRVDRDHVDLAERGRRRRRAPSSSRSRRARRRSSWSRKPSGRTTARPPAPRTSSRVHPPCSGWEANARLFTRATRPRPGRRRTAATRARQSSPRSRSTGSGRRIWNRSRSSRRPCSAATARSAAPASFDHQCTDPTAVRLCHGERRPDHVESSSRRGSAPGSTSTSTLHVSLPRSACAVARSRPPSSRALAISEARRRPAGRCRSAPRPEARGRYPRPRWADRELRRDARSRPSGGSPRSTPTRCASSTSTTRSSCWRPRSCRRRPPTSG